MSVLKDLVLIFPKVLVVGLTFRKMLCYVSIPELKEKRQKKDPVMVPTDTVTSLTTKGGSTRTLVGTVSVHTHLIGSCAWVHASSTFIYI